MWGRYLRRRTLKQLLSFGRLPSGSKEATDLSICLPFVLYVSLQLEPELWEKQEEVTTGDIVQGTRAEGMRKALLKATSSPSSHPVLKRFRARYAKDRVNRKPVNETAEKTTRTLVPNNGI